MTGKLKSLNVFLLLTTCVLTINANAQFFPKKDYPQNYFQWPVGAKVGIVANFGELRPNHYHMGLDCQTDQKQNLPVYAAADGYIAKVKIEPFGFGRCIYINHPNGYTTLYAHLNSFEPALEKYITEKQYQLQQWEIFIDIPPDLFPVNKADLIAYSGSTGGSQGPHVHFEIRDTKTDKVLNPSLFNFPLPDTIAPKIIRLAVYNRNISTYEQTAKLFPIKKINNEYVTTIPLILVNSDKISFAISAIDTYNSSSNPNGIYEAVLYEDENAIEGFQLDNISYDETRYLNAHIDYKLRSSGGPFLEHLSRLPGYTNSIYKTVSADGVISLNDTIVHSMKILVSDANGNESVLRFAVKKEGAAEQPLASHNNMFYPNAINVFENSSISFYLPENCLYDSFHFNYAEIIPKSGRTIFQLHNTSVPLQTYFPVKICDSFPPEDTGKVLMKRWAGSKEDYIKTTWDNGWYKAAFREFGNFQLMTDHIPPSIVPVGFKNGMKTAKLKRIVFAVTDNTETIKSFTALLDGKWLCFSNDKGRNFVYYFDEHCTEGIHELTVIAEDQVGNKTEKNYTFTR